MRIVICDDHHLLLEALATALALHGYTVEAAVDSPAEAVRAVVANDPDLLLIDLNFPAGSGLDAAREVLAHHRRTKVVMMTGEDDSAPLREALTLGVSGYLAKDQPVTAIAQALDLAVRGGTSVDDRLLRNARRAPAVVPKQRSAADDLTGRERHVLELLLEGRSTSEMVKELGVSQSTVRTHVQNIFAKLGVHTRLQAVALVAQEPARNGAARVGPR